VPRLRLNITMSLDGYVAGPDQSLEEPLGRGGMRLHDWAVELEAWRAEHGLEGGEVNASTEAIELSREHTGATIMGRNMFGGGPGPWREDEPWNGWWGDDPPFHHPVFVLTHHPRPRLDMAGGTSFVFVTDGIESALEQARDAAGDADISLAGGAATANQFLAAGLVDGMLISVAPVLLGSGERLFEGVGDLHGLRLQRAISGPAATHLVLSR
jgi:dihydrofolate reductase